MVKTFTDNNGYDPAAIKPQDNCLSHALLYYGQGKAGIFLGCRNDNLEENVSLKIISQISIYSNNVFLSIAYILLNLNYL